MQPEKAIPDKDTRAVARRLRRAGWAVDVRRSGHVHLTSPGGERIVTGSTPGDRRALRNLTARLRRIGRRA